MLHESSERKKERERAESAEAENKRWQEITDKPTPDECAKGIQTLYDNWQKTESRLAALREEVIEECAQVCDECRVLIMKERPLAVAREVATDLARLARQIRALKSNPTGRAPDERGTE